MGGPTPSGANADRRAGRRIRFVFVVIWRHGERECDSKQKTGQYTSCRDHGRACMLGNCNTAHLDDSAILAKQAMIAGNPAILDVFWIINQWNTITIGILCWNLVITLFLVGANKFCNSRNILWLDLKPILYLLKTSEMIMVKMLKIIEALVIFNFTFQRIDSWKFCSVVFALFSFAPKYSAYARIENSWSISRSILSDLDQKLSNLAFHGLEEKDLNLFYGDPDSPAEPFLPFGWNFNNGEEKQSYFDINSWCWSRLRKQKWHLFC